MPTPKKTATSPPVKNRSAAIRQSKLSHAEPDSRDVAAGLHFAPPAPPSTFDINITAAPEAKQALTLRTQAAAIVVKDRATHEQALEFVRGAKQLQRKITEHWQRITRGIDDLKRNMLNLKAQDLAPVEEAIRIAERAALSYEETERARAAQAEEAQRAERERKAREDRARELEAAEDRALELEQQSEGLSARELWFVTRVVDQDLNVDAPTTAHLKLMMDAARQAGYGKPDEQVARLLRSPKILAAVKAKRDAAAIREQAEARRQQPLHVIDEAPVEADVARGRGLPTTRAYHSCEVVDVNKLREAFLNGEVNAEALIPNEVYLNAQARAAKNAEIFERAFPGCRLRTRKGLAG